MTILRGFQALTVLLILAASTAFAQKAGRTPEQRTAAYLQSIRSDPNRLQMFLRDFPKGGDLHNHLAGAVHAESYLHYADESGLCLDRKSLTFVAPPCNSAVSIPSGDVYKDSALYSKLIDAFSMRDFYPGNESGHDHFFATFPKFSLAERGHTGEMIAEARNEAARDKLQYLELMITPNDGAASLGEKSGWESDFANLRKKLFAGGLEEVVAAGKEDFDRNDARANEILHCGSPQSQPGCGVTVRYLYQVLRGLPKEEVFAQLNAAFAFAGSDPKVVGLNMVMPEDGYVSMRDFDLHMRMLDFLVGIYPRVPVSLHAGELTPQLVPPTGLFHIRSSIEIGHARRIGHGVDVLEEPAPAELLREMAQRHVLVEICLTSNKEILGVSGRQHPLLAYLRAGVPVALATDDEGVSRSDLTREFVTFVQEYGADYHEIKTVARNSLEFSFMPGSSLWIDATYERKVPQCSHDSPIAASTSAACTHFLSSSQRAQQEWLLEKQFAAFEQEKR